MCVLYRIEVVSEYLGLKKKSTLHKMTIESGVRYWWDRMNLFTSLGISAGNVLLNNSSLQAETKYLYFKLAI